MVTGTVAVIVIGPLVVAALGNGNDTVEVIDTVSEATRMGPADSVRMLHFQKLDIYQRSIEFVALAHRVRDRLRWSLPRISTSSVSAS